MKLALLLAALSAPAFATELPADLAEAVKTYNQATLSNDVATLERLVDEDYVLVNSDSSVQNKRQFLSDFLVPGFKLDPSVLREPVRKVWGDAAVIGGVMELSWTQDGHRQTRELRVAYVWAKRDGQWRATYGQLTRVQ